MPEILRYQPGSFCWTELATTDSRSAKAFYSALFGWTVNDLPITGGGVYALMQIAGKDVAALAGAENHKGENGEGPHWFCYVSVCNAQSVASRAEELGGKILTAAFDVFDSGRMAVIQDPTGAKLGLWEPRAHIGARLGLELNTVCWTELLTPDRGLSTLFYTGLFGWTTKDEGEYTEFLLSGASQAGMMEKKDHRGMSPGWHVYFRVHDCDATTGKARDLGGKVIVPPGDIPGVGRFSTLQDPSGAIFSVIRLE